MKRAPYMSKQEMIEWLKIGVLAGEARAIAERTQDKEWRARLKTIATHAERITEERLSCLDPAQIVSVARRKNTAHVMLITEDQMRANKDDKELTTVAVDDLETLAELALCACMNCPQGDCVAGCEFRLAMHKLGIPVARDEVKPGECEFRWE